MRKTLWWTVVLASLSLVFTGCTREANKTEKISIGLKKIPKNGKVGALSYDTISHIVINVHNEGTLQVRNWDGHHHGNVVAYDGSPFEFTVKSGSSGLVQVLVVAEDSVNGSEAFLYDDKPFDNNNMTVNIEAVSIGTGTGTQGNVAGRYLFSGGAAGPTADLELMFTPPTRPDLPMKIMDTPIINGWFQMFLIDGAAFSYRMKHNGEVLFSGVDLANSQFAPAAHVVHLIQPAGEAHWGGGDSELRNEERYIAGFFGPGATSVSRHACYSATAGTVTNMYLGPGQTNPMYYDPTSTAGTHVRRKDNTGGSASTNTPNCGSTVAFDTRLDIDGKKIGQGKASAFGFESIFKLGAGQYDVIQTTNSGGTTTASWNYVTSDVLGANGVDGVSVFAQVNNFNGELGFGEDGVNCKRIASPEGSEMGFTKIMDVTGTATTASWAMTSTDFAKATIVACPYKVGYMDNPQYYFSGGRGPHNSSGSSMKQVRIAGSPTVLVAGCDSYTVQIEDGTGAPAPANGADSFTVVASNGGTFYSDACTTSTGSNITLNFTTSDSSKTFWFSRGTAGYTTLQLSPPPNNYSYYNGLELGVVPSGLQNPLNNYSVNVQDKMAKNSCYRVWIKRESSGYPTLDATGTGGAAAALSAMNLVWDDGSTPQSDGDFYTSSDCSSGLITTVNFSANSHRADVFFKPTAPLSGTLNRRVYVNTAAPAVSGSTSTIMVGGDQATKYAISGLSGSMSAGVCYSVYLVPNNDANAQVNSSGASVTVTLSGGIEFHGSDNTCGSGSPPSSGAVSVYPNSPSSSPFYIRHPSGTTPGSFGYNDGTLSGSGSFNP